MDSVIGAAKVEGFRKGNLVDGKIHQSTLYVDQGQLCSIVCNPRVLTGKGLMAIPLNGVLFPPGGKRH